MIKKMLASTMHILFHLYNKNANTFLDIEYTKSTNVLIINYKFIKNDLKKKINQKQFNKNKIFFGFLKIIFNKLIFNKTILYKERSMNV